MNWVITLDYRIQYEIKPVALVIQTSNADGQPRPPWARQTRNYESSVNLGNSDAPLYPRTHAALNSTSSDRIH
jgi:hypothetical protein